MDFTRLSSDELRDFLELNGVLVGDNMIEQAEALFNQPTTTYTEPVVDLYLANLLVEEGVGIPGSYSGQEILELSFEDRDAFAQITLLDPNDPHFNFRLIRILRWLNALAPVCGFTDWRTFNPLDELCMSVKDVNRQLLSKFLRDVTPDSLVLFHYADAVKFAQTEAEAEKYNIFPPGYFDLTYEQRAELFEELDTPLNPRRWSRQQWPKNTIAYCYRNNIKLIYVQCDLNYCKYPSMFAEANCGSLYFDHEFIDNPEIQNRGGGHRFSGDNTVLYNIGEFGVAYDLIQNLQPDRLVMKGPFSAHPQLSPERRVFDAQLLRNDLEWAHMSDSFRDSLYSYLLRGNRVEVASSYLYFPWTLMVEHLDLPVQPVDINIGTLNKANHVQRITYLNEIDVENANYYIRYKGLFLEPTWRIPAIYIFGLDAVARNDRAFGLLKLYVVQPLYISSKVKFDGTYQRPVISVNGRSLNNQIVRALASNNL